MWSVESQEFSLSLYALGARAEFAFLASSQALSSWASDVLFMMCVDEISGSQKGLEKVQLGDITVASLLFADDIVLLVSLDATLEHSLELFPNARM